jgi:hypothetical protein
MAFFFTVLHATVSLLHSSVNVHDVLGGGWPRWQPLNVAGVRSSESVLAGGNGNDGIQL